MTKDKRHAAQGAVERLNQQRNERELILGLLNTAYPLHSWIDYAGEQWQVHGVYISQCEAYIKLINQYAIENVPVANALLDLYTRNHDDG